MRLFLVLYSLYIALFALMMRAIGQYPNHPILTCVLITATALYSAYLWERGSRELFAADLQSLRRHLRRIGNKLGGLLLACHFPALWAVTIGTGAAEISLFLLGYSGRQALAVFCATFALTFVVSLMTYTIRGTGELGLPTIE